MEFKIHRPGEVIVWDGSHTGDKNQDAGYDAIHLMTGSQVIFIASDGVEYEVADTCKCDKFVKPHTREERVVVSWGLRFKAVAGPYRKDNFDTLQRDLELYVAQCRDDADGPAKKVDEPFGVMRMSKGANFFSAPTVEVDSLEEAKNLLRDDDCRHTEAMLFMNDKTIYWFRLPGSRTWNMLNLRAKKDER